MTDVFRQAHRELTPDEQQLLYRIKHQAGQLHELLERVEAREGAIARTKLEESVMWATKGVTA